MNATLATLLGWTSIEGLLGVPPGRNSGHVLIPDWLGTWAACGPLMLAHQISPIYDHLLAGAFSYPADAAVWAPWSDSPDRDTALRHIIVAAVIAKLKGHQS